MNCKIKTIFIILVLLTLMLVGCEKQQFLTNSFAIGYQNNIPYLIDTDGSTFSLENYDEIIPVFGDYLTVCKYDGENKKFGVIKRSGEVIIKCQYDMASIVVDDQIVVHKNNNTYIINLNNEILYNFPQNTTSYDYYQNGYLVVSINDKYSYLDTNFNLNTNKYDYAGHFINGYALVGNIVNNQMQYNFINESFEYLWPQDTLASYHFVDNFYDGFARIGKQNGNKLLYSFIGLDGTLLTDQNGNKEFTDCENFHNGIATVFSGIPNNNGYYRYQFINTLGEYTITNSISSTDSSQYNFGPYINGTLNIKAYDSGAGYWFLAKVITLKNDDGTSEQIINRIEINLPNNSQEDLQSYYSVPYDMSNLKESPYYTMGTSKVVTLAKVRIYPKMYGLITSDGNYVLDAIYDEIIY